MNVPLEVDPAELRRRAEIHARSIDEIKAARADRARMLSESQTLGPLYHQVREAIAVVAEKRDQSLAREQARHEQMREALLVSAAEYEATEAENRARLTIHPNA